MDFNFETLVFFLIILLFFMVYIFNKSTVSRLKNLEKMIFLQRKKSSLMIKQKMQACERFTLFLERNVPGELVLRMDSKTDNLVLYVHKLKKCIDQEFTHNIAQQLYVSTATWLLVLEAKNEFKNLLNEEFEINKNKVQSIPEFIDIVYRQKVYKDSAYWKALQALKNELKY